MRVFAVFSLLAAVDCVSGLDPESETGAMLQALRSTPVQPNTILAEDVLATEDDLGKLPEGPEDALATEDESAIKYIAGSFKGVTEEQFDTFLNNGWSMLCHFLDTNHDHFVSGAEMVAAEEAVGEFVKFLYSSAGKLVKIPENGMTVGEAATAMKTLQEAAYETFGPGVKAIFKAIAGHKKKNGNKKNKNRNKNKKKENDNMYDIFTGAVQTVNGASEEDARLYLKDAFLAFFTRLDADKNGKVTLEEIQTAIGVALRFVTGLQDKAAMVFNDLGKQQPGLTCKQLWEFTKTTEKIAEEAAKPTTVAPTAAPTEPTALEKFFAAGNAECTGCKAHYKEEILQIGLTTEGDVQEAKDHVCGQCEYECGQDKESECPEVSIPDESWE